MKLLYFAFLLITFFSCTNQKSESEQDVNDERKEEVIIADFDSIIDAAGVKGSILIYDLTDQKYFSNDFKWAKRGNLPASTFKITNSIIALETGVIEDDSTLMKWDGEKRSFKIWEQDLVFRDAFHFSCVPCYQEVAREIGVHKMSQYLDKLEFGNMKVDSSNLDIFWLEGESRISQFQQIDFIKRLYQSELPISDRTDVIIKKMMVIEENANYKLSGKTGWSNRGEVDNGWFVGYVEAKNKVYLFATNVEPKKVGDLSLFVKSRKEVTIKALEQMGEIQ